MGKISEFVPASTFGPTAEIPFIQGGDGENYRGTVALLFTEPHIVSPTVSGDLTELKQNLGMDQLAPKDNPTFTGQVTGVTKSMVGLENVDNTADTDKPVSSATAEALAEKVDKTTTVNGHPLDANVTLSKNDLGLNQIDNTADLNKPVSLLARTELAPKQNPIFVGTVAINDIAPHVIFDDQGQPQEIPGQQSELHLQGALHVGSEAAIDGGIAATIGTLHIYGYTDFGGPHTVECVIIGNTTNPVGVNGTLQLNGRTITAPGGVLNISGEHGVNIGNGTDPVDISGILQINGQSFQSLLDGKVSADIPIWPDNSVAGHIRAGDTLDSLDIIVDQLTNGNVVLSHAYFGAETYITAAAAVSLQVNGYPGVTVNQAATYIESPDRGTGITIGNNTLYIKNDHAAPAIATSTGQAGEVRFDANYMYRCVATNTWKRIPLSTW